MGTWSWLARWFRPPGSIGVRGENLAARYLQQKGYRILARRWRCRGGELDLVALAGRTLVIVEVKTRRSHSKGHPATAVDHEKQRRIARTARQFLKTHQLLGQPVRFDIVAITWPSERDAPIIEHFPHAFEAPDG